MSNGDHILFVRVMRSSSHDYHPLLSLVLIKHHLVASIESCSSDVIERPDKKQQHMMANDTKDIKGIEIYIKNTQWDDDPGQSRDFGEGLRSDGQHGPIVYGNMGIIIMDNGIP